MIKVNKRGLTIVEVIIALALLAISIGGILGVLVQNASTGKSIDYTYIASNLAKNRIERLREVRRDIGYANLADWHETDVTINRNGVSDPDGDFQRTTVVEPDFGANLTRITVRVKYKRGGTFLPVSAELVTLISPYYQ